MFFPAVGVSLLAAGAACLIPGPVHVNAATTAALAYNKDGSMLPPTNYREWIYLTTGFDMSYRAKSDDVQEHSMFDTVFVSPESYRSFLSTGTWPDKTVMILEVREAKSKGSINQHGHFQGTDVMGFEVHVKDEARFAGKWAFFEFDTPSKNGTLVPQGAPCYTCHQSHAAVDTTFVQFYPTLLPIAHQKGTLSAEYLKEEPQATAK
jgi:hypothetical protein